MGKGLKSFLGILFGLIIIAATLYWYSTPQHAVGELARAVENGDAAIFYSRVDLERLIDSTVDAEATLKNTKVTPESRLAQLETALGTSVDKLFKGERVNAVKHEIELKAAGRKEPHLPPGGTLSQSFFREAERFTFGQGAMSGPAFLVNGTVQLTKIQKTYPLVLRFEKSDKWRLVGFEGLSAALASYDADRTLKLDTYNNQVQTDLMARLPFFGQVRWEKASLGLERVMHLEFLFKNTDSKVLQNVQGVLKLNDYNGKSLWTEPFHVEGLAVPAGEKKVFLLDKKFNFIEKAPISEEQEKSYALLFYYEDVMWEPTEHVHIVARYEDL